MSVDENSSCFVIEANSTSTSLNNTARAVLENDDGMFHSATSVGVLGYFANEVRDFLASPDYSDGCCRKDLARDTATTNDASGAGVQT